MSQFDFIVIGAGMAGASVASELAAHSTVLMLEAETQAGYHTTGRSAALFTRAYGPAPIRALTRASEAFLRAPDSPWLDGPLLTKRRAMYVARADQQVAYQALQDELGDAVKPLGGAEAMGLVPLFREGHIKNALIDETASDVDVNALHQHFLREFRARGGTTKLKARVERLERTGQSWTVTASGEEFKAGAIINAAGAWCDEVAQMAGSAGLGLVPKRRTVLLVDCPPEHDSDGWPMVIDAQEEFFMKPEAGKLLISPADETPSSPCDAQPEDFDIAVCVDRIERTFEISIARIDQKWAGLRSFFSDKSPVAGYDPVLPGFFWLAGQGGYGIQTAPALARLSAALALGNSVPADILSHGVSAADLAPDRPALSR